MSKHGLRLLFATALAIIGGIVAWRALHRSTHGPEASRVAIAPVAPDRLRTLDSYELRPTDPASLHRSAELISDMVRQARAEFAAAGVSADQIQRLAGQVGAKVELLLSGPSGEQFRAFALTEGAIEFREFSDHLSEERKQIYEAWSELWRFTPFSAERAFVRVIGPDDQWDAPREWQQVSSRHPLRPRYPMPTASGYRIQVAIPVLARSLESKRHTVPADISLTYRWNSELNEWNAINTTLHMAKEDANKLVPPP